MSDQHTPDTPPKDDSVQAGDTTQDKAGPSGGNGADTGKAGQSAAATPPQATAQAGPERPPMNPYLAGVFLGLTLLASYLILGAGLGASGALARFGAWAEHLVLPARVEANAYFGPWFPGPLSYYLVFMAVGVFAGGLFSALSGGRVRVGVERGPTASRMRRLILALLGGVLAGFASRLAMGCTSGQGLSGGAIFLTGSFVFMGCLFAAGYLSAWAFRRQWK